MQSVTRQDLAAEIADVMGMLDDAKTFLLDDKLEDCTRFLNSAIKEAKKVATLVKVGK